MTSHAWPRSFFNGLPLFTASVALSFAALNASAQNKKPPAPVAPAAPEVVCSSTDFKVLAYTINEVSLREERAKEWLRKFGPRRLERRVRVRLLPCACKLASLAGWKLRGRRVFPHPARILG